MHGHELTVEAWATIVGLGDDDDELAWSTLLAAMGIEDLDRWPTFSADPRGAGPRRTATRCPCSRAWRCSSTASPRPACPIGVASSSSVEWLERHLERLGLLHRFGTLVGADVVGGVGKPAPDVYLRACADLGADPSRSVALEDSAHGVTAAKAAGMVAVAVPSRITRHNDFTHADLVVGVRGRTSPSTDLASLVERARPVACAWWPSPSAGSAGCAARPALRRLVAETRLGVDDLVAPLFVREGIDEPQPIASLPGVVQHTRESLRKEVSELAGLGIPARHPLRRARPTRTPRARARGTPTASCSSRCRTCAPRWATTSC